MNYEEYVKMQVDGEIIKPIHYHIGEWKAINMFFEGYPREAKILDVGCGIGYGVGIFKKLGFTDVIGIDLNPRKIELGKRLGYNIYQKDIMEFQHDNFLFDVIWCSHAFEHMLDPDAVIKKMLDITTDNASFVFILPYPDLYPSPIHCAAPILGTNIDAQAETVVGWFEDRGLSNMVTKFDNFREPEVWLEFVKQ